MNQITKVIANSRGRKIYMSCYKNKNLHNEKNQELFNKNIDYLTYGTSLFFSSFCIYRSYNFYKNKLNSKS